MFNPPRSIVCLFDCDNTLLDNDGLKADLDRRLRSILGDIRLEAFWAAYENARLTMDTVDFPLTIEKVRTSFGQDLADQVWNVIWNYPFPDRLYPASLAVLKQLRDQGVEVGIVSDGDMVYQPHKIAESGLENAANSHVKVYIHKQEHLGEILAWLPATNYIFVDDKAAILGDVKRGLGARATTVHVRQGHYRDQPGTPPPDVTIEHIADLLRVNLVQHIQTGSLGF